MMAIIYPENPNFNTNGEKHIFLKILLNLPDVWHVFYEPNINGLNPDFILFHPRYGLTVIEIKDYTKSTIQSTNPFTWKLNWQGYTKTVKSPLQQVTHYRNETYNLLAKNESLRIKEGKFKGRLKFPISCLCCFPNLSSKDLLLLNIQSLIPEKILLSKEDSVNMDSFIEKLLSSFNRLFPPKPLSEKELGDVIFSLYPSFQYYTEQTSNTYKNNPKEVLNDFVIKSFNNYVDELIYVTDSIAHYINFYQKSLEDIIIVYNPRRPSIPSSKKYLDLLIELLSSKNLSTSHNKDSKNRIRLYPYEKLTQINVNTKKVFMIDFNNIQNDVLDNIVFPLLNKSKDCHFVTLSSNDLINH
ncbi:nuclease-related domain-containing protein [Bacillus kexueae]|uniref:nuclease-related domain-containing protein n=1 Tax=Aeribacillus kexueae TaxID=2078952 RepID=UPI001FAFDF04|nr:nuclease-related domain-containing protein [Bacillus kexueae]